MLPSGPHSTTLSFVLKGDPAHTGEQELHLSIISKEVNSNDYTAVSWVRVLTRVARKLHKVVNLIYEDNKDNRSAKRIQFLHNVV